MTVERLIQINQRFYTEFASSFSCTRSAPWRGFDGLLQHLPSVCDVLDIGCGNGRLAQYLDSCGVSGSYLGLDFSKPLLALARREAQRLTLLETDFGCVDITKPDWTLATSGRDFDAVATLAVLQHIPSFRLRSEVLGSAAGLLRQSGVLVLSSWQFLSSERHRSRVVPWSLVGLSRRDVEDGDYLLDWRREGLSYRYCHLLTEQELVTLAAQAGLRVVQSYRADGPTDASNIYAVLEPA